MTTQYYMVNVDMSENQLRKLYRAIDSGTSVSFRNITLGQNIPLFLTEKQKHDLATGKMSLKLSAAQLEHLKRYDGGSLFSTIASFLPKLLPAIKTVAKVAAPAVLTGAVAAGANRLTHKVADKIEGKGYNLPGTNPPYRGGALQVTIPEHVVRKFVKFYENPNNEKTGGFLGTLLAGLLPTLLGGLFGGKGMPVQHKRKMDAMCECLEGKKKGSGLLGKALGLPGGQIPILSKIPLLGALF